ncbi:MAG: hypothetical protein Q9164_007688 [Protoblastenia rupestris]
MFWISQILLSALCHTVRGAFVPSSTGQSLVPANQTVITPDLSEPGKPRATGHVDYHDETHIGTFCRFTPRYMTETSRILGMFKMSPVITDALSFAFDHAVADHRGRLTPLPGGPRGKHFLNFGVIVRMMPAAGVPEL